MPKRIKNTLKEVVHPGVITPSSHSYSSSNNSPENTFIINGVPDLCASEFMQTEDDAASLDKSFRQINEDSANTISARRLGKKRASTKNSSGSQGVQCHPLLVTPGFCASVLRKVTSYKTMNIDYIKKYLTSSERSVKKKLLAKKEIRVTTKW